MDCRLFALVCLAAAAYGADKGLPSYVKVCDRKNSDIVSCLKESFGIVFSHGDKGIPEMHIRPFNPILLDKLSILEGNSGSVNLDAQLTDVKLYGIKDSTLESIDIDFESGAYNCEIFTPAVYLEANFGAKGKILLLEFNGNGIFRGNMTGVRTKVKYTFESYEKKGKEHWKLANSNFDCIIDNFAINLEELFADNKDLSEAVQAALDENIQIELQPVIVNTIETVVNDIVTHVFDKFPLDVLHPK
ncbi:PREDICTED: uncharacterized protein LOC108560261 [Nicrophorus vespilloides]|uniref:Uncharacterized protein LOC108560261 n=1 Tax=Nicrophorus vespilloides TaxID=110193 RepID=A0ABM1MF62_NICVS|nr:PREDICTED: uncharacterized protein LOC108560261 [Nicrophorus vespilloides]